jgi:hypothetical protein
LNEDITLACEKDSIIIKNDHKKERIAIPNTILPRIINSLRNRKANEYYGSGFYDQIKIDDTIYITLRVLVNDRSLSEVQIAKYRNDKKTENCSLYYIPGSERQDINGILEQMKELVPPEMMRIIQPGWGFRKRHV